MEQDERTRPDRVKILKLQEAHIAELMTVERACAEKYYELGFDAAEVPVGSEQDFYKMPKNHAVRVAEADYKPVGYVAFRDEAPGIVYIEDLEVHPDLWRFGLGRELLGRVAAETRELGLDVVIAKVFVRAEFAREFYHALGFLPIDDAAPAAAKEWLTAKQEAAEVYPRPDQQVLWVSAKVLAAE